jgi:hypothetical protein
VRPGLDLGAVVRAALPVLAIGSFAAVSGIVVAGAVAAGTFGFDFLAYHQAATRVLHGERLYDPATLVAGGYGLFLYPPPVVLAILPFALLPALVAAWLWLLLSVVMLVVAIAILPVAPTVRWVTLLLAGLSWPVAYALKLGQVGPLLMLVFAIVWRWLDRTDAVGAAAAFGTIVKIQPGILLVWALLTRRYAAVAVGVGILLAAALVATVVLGGIGVWQDYVALVRNVSDPITTPHNFTPGSTAYQAGVPAGIATAIQLASSVLVVIAVIAAAAWTRPDASLLVAVVASQLLSPVLWDHYAVLLLLPVAWLLGHRMWWAVLIPFATSTATLFVTLPAWIYPALFWITLLAVLWTGLRVRSAEEP